jgi:hypothetical protein
MSPIFFLLASPEGSSLYLSQTLDPAPWRPGGLGKLKSHLDKIALRDVKGTYREVR